MLYKEKKAFTLVELMVVIVVIGILTVITVISYRYVQASSRDSSRSSLVEQIKASLNRYNNDKGSYPVSCDALGNNCEQPITSGLKNTLVPDYIDEIESNNISNNFRYYSPASGSWYAIYVPYENKSACKAGVNIQQVNTVSWLNSSTPECSN